MEVMFPPLFICCLVGLSPGLWKRNNFWKLYQNYWWKIGHRPRINPFNFGRDPGKWMDPGMFLSLYFNLARFFWYCHLFAHLQNVYLASKVLHWQELLKNTVIFARDHSCTDSFGSIAKSGMFVWRYIQNCWDVTTVSSIPKPYLLISDICRSSASRKRLSPYKKTFRSWFLCESTLNCTNS